MLGQSQDARPRAITTLLVASLAVAAALPWRVVAADSQVNTPYFAQATDEQETPATSPAANPAPAANPSPAAKAAPARIVDKRSAEYRTMYDMPTPPTPATPATPAAPAAPMSRMAPPPPPPAPAAPAAPKAPKASSSSFSYSTIDDHGATRHHQSINDSHGYITVANEDGVWELRDPAYLTRIRAIYNNAFKDGPAGPAPAMDPKRAAELAQREAMLSEQMAKLAERQAQMSIAEANPGHAQRDPAAYAEGRAAIGREQADVGRQMGEVARERAMQGRTEAEWNRAIADRSQKANDEVKAVLDDARRNHALVRAD